MPNTEHYNLTKPNQTDFYDVEVMNSNLDKIDEALHNHVEDKSAHGATSTPTANRIVKYDENGRTPLDATTKGELLPKNNPSATGVTTVDHLQTSFSYHKELGNITFAANTANQKVDIEFPKESLHGNLQLEISSYYGTVNYTGNLVYRAAFHASDTSTTIHGFFARYVEATGHLAKYVAVSPMRFDSVKKKFVISISFSRGDLPAALLSVTMTGQSITTASRTSMMKAALSAVYTTNTDVYPLPVVSYNDQVAFNAPSGTSPFLVTSQKVVDNLNVPLHNGWRNYGTLGDLNLVMETATIMQIVTAMANQSTANITKPSSQSAPVGVYPANNGLMKITKWDLDRVDLSFKASSGSVVTKWEGSANTGGFSGWKLVGLADGTVQNNFNTHLHNGWRRYSAYGELGLTATANMADIIDKLVDKSEVLIEVSVSNQIALGLTTNDYGTLKIVRHNALRVYAMFYNFNGDTKRGTHTSGAWVGWELQVGVKRIPNPHFWTADKPASLEVGTIIYTAVT